MKSKTLHFSYGFKSAHLKTADWKVARYQLTRQASMCKTDDLAQAPQYNMVPDLHFILFDTLFRSTYFAEKWLVNMKSSLETCDYTSFTNCPGTFGGNGF